MINIKKKIKKNQEKKASNYGHAKSACLGKVQHKSMLGAEYTLQRMNGRDSHLLEVYKCHFCKFYHIGHNRFNKKNIA